VWYSSWNPVHTFSSFAGFATSSGVTAIGVSCARNPVPWPSYTGCPKYVDLLHHLHRSIFNWGMVACTVVLLLIGNANQNGQVGHLCLCVSPSQRILPIGEADLSMLLDDYSKRCLPNQHVSPLCLFFVGVCHLSPFDQWSTVVCSSLLKSRLPSSV